MSVKRRVACCSGGWEAGPSLMPAPWKRDARTCVCSGRTRWSLRIVFSLKTWILVCPENGTSHRFVSITGLLWTGSAVFGLLTASVCGLVWNSGLVSTYGWLSRGLTVAREPALGGAARSWRSAVGEVGG